MGVLAPPATLSSLLLLVLAVSSSLANPIPLDRAADVWPEDSIGNVVKSQLTTVSATTPVADKLTCDNTGADLCLLFPIGCVPAVNCTDRLQIRRVQSGSAEGDILISLNLHVSRRAHMLVAVPMPDRSNPNSTFLVGCAIDEDAAVVARPDVDGVTEKLQMDWLRLVGIRSSPDDLECVVSAAAGHVDLPVGDVAVFAGDLEEELPVLQSARIAGSISEDERAPVVGGEKGRTEEERRPEVEPEVEPEVPTTHHPEAKKDVVIESRIEKVQVPHEAQPEHHAIPALEHSEDSAAPILIAVEDHRPSTSAATEQPSPSTTVSVSSTAKSPTRLRLKQLHSSEGSSSSSPEKQHHHHRHSSPDSTHAPHAETHHHHTTTTTSTTVAAVTTTEKEKEETETTPVAEDRPQMRSDDSDPSSTTVSLPHHEQHRGVHAEHTTTTPHHSHEHHRASIDSEHHSVRLPVPSTTTTTTTEKPKSFEDDKDIAEADKELLRELKAGHMKPDGREEDGDEEDEEDSTGHQHADGSHHGKHVTTYELSREAAQDPIGKPLSEHTHHHHSHSHSDDAHSHFRAATVDEEEEDTGAKRKLPEKSEDDEEEEEERRERMGEKKHQRRDERNEEEDEDDDDSTSSMSLIVPLIVCIAPVLWG